MLISTFCFSLMTIGVKYLNHIPFFELVFFRCIVSLGLTYYYIRRNKLNPWGNNKKLLIQRGLYGTVALCLLFLSIQNLPLASASTLSYLAPIFTAIFAIFLLKEKVKNIQWLCFMIAFAGIILIKGFDGKVSLFFLIVAVSSAILAGFSL